MNANELAQYLEEQMSGWATDLVLREAANMLRQQYTSLISDVEVIERLAKEIQVKDEAIFNSEKQAYNLAMQVQNQKFEIEALKAHPVNPYKVITDTKIEPTVVSYTHPEKEQRMIDVLMELSKYRLLSKEEIEEVAILRKTQEVNPI